MGSGGSSQGGSGAVNVTPGDAPTTFACDATLPPPMDQLRPLTTAQVQNTLPDLLTWAISSASTASAILGEVAAPMGSLPGNVPIVPSNNSDLGDHFPGRGLAARRSGSAVHPGAGLLRHRRGGREAATSSGARMGVLAGAARPTPAARTTRACLTTFIQTFGARALRRPLTTDEVTFYSGVYGATTTADPAAYADVIAAMLNSPDFLYFVEHGGEPVAGQPGVYALSAVRARVAASPTTSGTPCPTTSSGSRGDGIAPAGPASIRARWIGCSRLRGRARRCTGSSRTTCRSTTAADHAARAASTITT